MGTKFKGSKKEVQALDAFIKLKRAAESLSSRLISEFTKWSISESQFGVLETLYHLGPLCQKDLGDKILKSTGNITLVIDNLEKRSLVERVRSVEDRRFISVHLTTEGKKLIEQIFPDHVKRITSEFAVLSPEEQEVLGKICKKLGKKTDALCK
ncbi:MarR family transcriptional regulator [Leptospira kanakyensis]|uniref:MarR family transcriptional regulator n=1 Tax=Leptospira kanakyensis TaxID=2484968 RepID=A0A6N4Q4P9_9LEPT|nr:MarR family transcriptional regulator [Leptospira kanakyensis]TGK50402.1 MarR family transcriptional regulator [Leptospira kanakyensis]TGK63996.1 MarR family transcriptional regulator [Leptospira kanakyensis]TGK69540.1 MarR family transcriptional regulator [Leptospira kanakyensis]